MGRENRGFSEEPDIKKSAGKLGKAAALGGVAALGIVGYQTHEHDVKLQQEKSQHEVQASSPENFKKDVDNFIHFSLNGLLEQIRTELNSPSTNNDNLQHAVEEINRNSRNFQEFIKNSPGTDGEKLALRTILEADLYKAINQVLSPVEKQKLNTLGATLNLAER